MKSTRQILRTTLAVAIAAAAIPAAAGTTTSGFNVTVNLTGTCAVTAAPTPVAFTYVSFQPGSATATGGDFQVTCTNLLPYTFSLDATAPNVAGLTYALGFSAGGGTGNGAAQSYQITGNMPGGQSGDCGVAICTGSQARVLTVNF